MEIRPGSAETVKLNRPHAQLACRMVIQHPPFNLWIIINSDKNQEIYFF